MAASSHDPPPVWRTYILGVLVYLLLGLVIIVGMNWWLSHDILEDSIDRLAPREDHDSKPTAIRPQSDDRNGLRDDDQGHRNAAGNGRQSMLSPTMRRIIWEELILADRRAHAPLTTERGEGMTPLLKEGQELHLVQRMAIWPVYGYQHRRVTAGGRRELGVGTTVIVEDIIRKDGTVWYGVDALSPEGIAMGHGWVEHQILASQLPQDFYKRPDRETVQALRLELYERELMAKFGVTRETLAAIRQEGRRKQWPVPPVDSESNGS